MVWIVFAIMVLHGLVHLMGGLSELGIAAIPELSGETLIRLPGYMHQILGAIWFLCVVLFILSAIGLAARRPWWKVLAVIAVAVSQTLIILWWPDAKAGTVANLLILAALLYNPIHQDRPNRSSL
ncbi:hypothetical protein G5B47_15470 [Paenibacillus sp. 7124]|uniref:DoxX-like family protein n=1 Tax=Paenibacillus apii TaxID=1850370 RepID=A0A6M1PK87_9BACL|nr:hypothetical protein [Paenibacillus apii]NGM83819.1 hypothetical protein [Paenibacillus apii]